MICGRCRKEVPEEQLYIRRGKPMCEYCLMHAGLFPPRHNGQFKKLLYIKDSRPDVFPVVNGSGKEAN